MFGSKQLLKSNFFQRSAKHAPQNVWSSTHIRFYVFSTDQRSIKIAIVCSGRHSVTEVLLLNKVNACYLGVPFLSSFHNSRRGKHVNSFDVLGWEAQKCLLDPHMP